MLGAADGCVLVMQSGLGLVKDVQEDGNVTIDLFLLASVLTEEICITTAMVPACQPANRPYDVCLGEPGTREVARWFLYGAGCLGSGICKMYHKMCKVQGF